MRFEIRKFNCDDPAEALLNKKLLQKHVVERIPTRPRKGIHFEKRGYTVNVVFSCNLKGLGLHNAFLRLSRREIFLLARLFRGDKSDKDFLAAILGED